MVIGFREGNNWKFYYQSYATTDIRNNKLVNVGVDLCVPIN